MLSSFSGREYGSMRCCGLIHTDITIVLFDNLLKESDSLLHQVSSCWMKQTD